MDNNSSNTKIILDKIYEKGIFKYFLLIYFHAVFLNLIENVASVLFGGNFYITYLLVVLNLCLVVYVGCRFYGLKIIIITNRPIKYTKES